MMSKLILLCCLVLYAEGGFEQDCGLEARPATEVVGWGQTVKANEFPWQVAIFKKNNGQFKQICGGSLVRSELVITAAHCFSDEFVNHEVNEKDYRVVGGSRRSSWTARTSGKQTREVRAVRLGERYGGINRNFQNDIAVVHLKSGFTFSPVVRAVCLDLMDRELHNTQTSPGSVGKVAGWGLTESGTPSDHLMFLSVPILEDEQCARQIFRTYSAYTSYITADKICAGLNGSAMCPGDSGAGLVFPLQTTETIPPRWYLQAVLSSTPNVFKLSHLCPINAIALYTNVSTHREWLSITMEEFQPQESCRVKGSAGVCREFSACPRAMERTARGILPQHCSPSSTKICCVETVETCPPLPPSAVSQRKTGSKAHDYCVDLPEKLYPCQQNGSSWSRGDLCGPNPERHNPKYWVSRLTKASVSEKQRFGLVSFYMGKPVHLISERWLLTRASDWDDLPRLRVRDITPPPEVIFSSSRTVRHPQSIPRNNTYSGTNDIVLVEMDRPVPFSRSYRPVCLHTAQDSLGVGGLTLTRWNWGDSRDPVTLLSQEMCRRNFPPGSDGAASGVTDSHLCVTTSSGGICGFGNYLTASNGPRAGGCTQLLVGLVLDGKNDGSTCMELYLRVSSYIPWVESVVWP